MSIEMTEGSESHQQREQDKQRDLLTPCGESLRVPKEQGHFHFSRKVEKSIKPKNLILNLPDPIVHKPRVYIINALVVETFVLLTCTNLHPIVFFHIYLINAHSANSNFVC